MSAFWKVAEAELIVASSKSVFGSFPAGNKWFHTSEKNQPNVVLVLLGNK